MADRVYHRLIKRKNKEKGGKKKTIYKWSTGTFSPGCYRGVVSPVSIIYFISKKRKLLFGNHIAATQLKTTSFYLYRREYRIN